MAEADRLVAFETPPRSAFHHSPTDRAQPDPAVDDRRVGETVTGFLRALLDRRTVRLRYRSPYQSAESESEARPLGLLWDRNLWYLVGAKQLPDDGSSLRQWRADRVVRLVPGSALPNDEPPFDVRALLGRAWLDQAMRDWATEAPVRIRLTPAQVALLQRDWYYGHARFELEPDGTVLMTYGEDNKDAALALVRWLGPGAELIEPVAWRTALRHDLAALLDAHPPPESPEMSGDGHRGA
jgi:predicted DNA-binding transcriptional regulator YafY